ncbi:unnamed protein product [Rhodiola kirilowii]
MDRAQLLLLGLPIIIFCSDLFNLFTPPPPKPPPHHHHAFGAHDHSTSHPVPQQTLEFPNQVSGIGVGNTVLIRFCSSCSYKGNAVKTKEMLMTEFPGLEVVLENYPPTLPKRMLSKLVPVVQVGMIGVMMGGEQIFPRLGYAVPPPWYHKLRANRFGTISTTWLLGNFFQSFLQSSGAFEVYCNGALGAVWAIALLISLALFSDGSSANRAIFDVTSYGAKGDGITNDAPAFLKAWKDVCSSKENHPVLLIPARKSFVLSSIEFIGPCAALSVGVSVSGNVLLSSTNKMDWKTCHDWISFTEIANLEVHGSGIIDGNGAKWWKDELSCGKRPTNFALNRCINASLRGIHSKDSARNHISVAHCKGVTISHITITAPADSPNTDGIDISSSTHVTVTDSHIGSGDDCIAINNHCNNINITKIVCGPGHGISVGSLGKGGEVAEVEDIYVHNCTLVGTANGARVKTWKVGKGYARRITYSDIILKNVRRPIIIDQTYVNRYQKPRGSSVAISDVKFLKFEGTCQKNDAITLKCNDLGPGCIDIEISDVTITSATRSPVKATCQNAHGRSMRTQPKVQNKMSQCQKPIEGNSGKNRKIKGRRGLNVISADQLGITPSSAARLDGRNKLNGQEHSQPTGWPHQPTGLLEPSEGPFLQEHSQPTGWPSISEVGCIHPAPADRLESDSPSQPTG